MTRRALATVAVIATCLLLTSVTASSTTFDQKPKFKTLGSASISGSELILTPDTENAVGGGWSKKRVVTSGFTATFTFSITSGAGDGMAFLVAAKKGLTGPGGGLGYNGLPHSLAVEIDTFQNPEAADLSNNHISIHTNCEDPNSTDENDSVGSVTPGTNMADGADHTLEISYTTPGYIDIKLDGGGVLNADVDLTCLGLKKGAGVLGWTAANGGATGIHTVKSYAFS